MTKYVYEIPILADLGKVSKAVGGIMADVNKTMHSFGFPETLCIETEVSTFVITSSVALPIEQLERIRSEIEASIDHILPPIGGRVGQPRQVA